MKLRTHHFFVSPSFDNIKNESISIMAAFALFVVASTCTSVVAVPLKVIILAGQSNMEGQAEVDMA